MNTEFTPVTRPRGALGVLSWMVCRLALHQNLRPQQRVPRLFPDERVKRLRPSRGLLPVLLNRAFALAWRYRRG